MAGLIFLIPATWILIGDGKFILYFWYYVVCWPISNYLIVFSDRFIEPYLWPLAPFFSIVILASEIITSILKYFRKNVFHLIIEGLERISIFLVFAFAFYLLISWLPEQLWMPKWATAILYITLLFYVNGIDILKGIKDNILFKYWGRKSEVITTEVFLDRILKLNLKSSCIKLVRDIRKKSLLNNDKETLRLVESLAVNLEYAIRAKIRPENTDKSLDFFALWIDQFSRKHREGIGWLGSQFLDEMYLLVEQLHRRSEK